MTTRGVGLSEEEREDERPWTLGEILEAHRIERLGPLGPVKCHACDEWKHGTIHDHHADLALAFFDVAARLAHTADLAAQVAAAWDEGVDAAFRGAVTRQNGDDVKRRNPYRTEPADPRTHGLNHAPLPEGTLLDPGFCAGCDALRAALSPAQPDTERGGGS